jgi:hypothetical protein
MIPDFGNAGIVHNTFCDGAMQQKTGQNLTTLLQKPLDSPFIQ